MTAKELILTIKSMNDFERTEFGQALRDCGVAVVLTRKLGVATQEKGGDPTQDEINRVNAYHARQIDSLGRVKVPPIKETPNLKPPQVGSNTIPIIVDDPMRKPTEDEIKRVKDYYEAMGQMAEQGIGRVSVPPMKSVKDYDATKKGSPVEE